jgi:hypothetical protein
MKKCLYCNNCYCVFKNKGTNYYACENYNANSAKKSKSETEMEKLTDGEICNYCLYGKCKNKSKCLSSKRLK